MCTMWRDEGLESRHMKILAAIFFLALGVGSAHAQVLYNNGPDPGTIGAWPINFGQSVANSFNLEADSTVSSVVLSIWTVDDRNPPQSAKWKITTEAFGGAVLASGESVLGLITYSNGRLYTVWTMRIQNMNARISRGTYYLQIYDVLTQWRSWAYWGQNNGGGCSSPGCPSNAVFDPALADAYSLTRPIGSESFEVMGTPGESPDSRK